MERWNGPCKTRCQIGTLSLQVNKKLAEHFYILTGDLKALKLTIIFVCLGKRTSFRTDTICKEGLKWMSILFMPSYQQVIKASWFKQFWDSKDEILISVDFSPPEKYMRKVQNFCFKQNTEKSGREGLMFSERNGCLQTKGWN